MSLLMGSDLAVYGEHSACLNPSTDATVGECPADINDDRLKVMTLCI